MFARISDAVSVSPQITVGDVARAAKQGFTAIINNRPDGEDVSQPSGDDIKAAALAAGISYVAIPVTHAGFSESQVRAMAEALAAATGPVLAYCRSGTRSTLLWALAEASCGADPATLASRAAAAGYDISPVRPMMDVLAASQG